MKIITSNADTKLKVEFTRLVRECIQKAIEEFGVYELEDVNIYYDLKGQCAGQAIGHGDGTFTLRFNVEAIQKDFNDMANDTIPHEVAHLVCYVRPELGKNHNRGWKNVCIQLGGSGDRTHSIELTRAKTVRRFVYELDDGTELQLTSHKHKKVLSLPSGAMYLPAQYTNSKREMTIEKHHFVKEIKIK